VHIRRGRQHLPRFAFRPRLAARHRGTYGARLPVCAAIVRPGPRSMAAGWPVLVTVALRATASRQDRPPGDDMAAVCCSTTELTPVRTRVAMRVPTTRGTNGLTDGLTRGPAPNSTGVGLPAGQAVSARLASRDFVHGTSSVRQDLAGRAGRSGLARGLTRGRGSQAQGVARDVVQAVSSGNLPNGLYAVRSAVCPSVLRAGVVLAQGLVFRALAATVGQRDIRWHTCRQFLALLMAARRADVSVRDCRVPTGKAFSDPVGSTPGQPGCDFRSPVARQVPRGRADRGPYRGWPSEARWPRLRQGPARQFCKGLSDTLTDGVGRDRAGDLRLRFSLGLRQGRAGGRPPRLGKTRTHEQTPGL
jgi:hypothetical protein